MPVLTKTHLDALEGELRSRFANLLAALEARPLKHDQEGANGGRWGKPENMRATEGSSMDIRLAAEDFRSVLAEIKRLK